MSTIAFVPARCGSKSIKLKNISADVLQKKLQPYKIMVRDCFNFDTLDNRFIRVAIKDKKSIQRFIEAIYDIKY